MNVGWGMVVAITAIYCLGFLLFDNQVVASGLIGIWTGAIARSFS